MPVTDVDITIANPDPNDCPETFTELIVLLRQLLSGTVEGDFTPYVVQAEEPSVEERDYIWHKLDDNGAPIGTYKFYDGNWRKTYPCPIGTIWAFYGDPSVHFDATGLGTVGGEWDGWRIMRGYNPGGGAVTENMSNRMLIAGNLEAVDFGYSADRWRTTITGSPEVIIGESEITLDAATTYRPPRDAVTLYKWEADNNHAESAGTIYGVGGAPQYPAEILAADAGNETPDPISIVPPVLAIAWVQFMGYE